MSRFKIEDINQENEDGENDDQTKYHQLKRENEEKEEKIKVLEKKYLESITRLLIMVQAHCEIKTEMYNKFKETGIIKEEKKEN